MRILDRYFSNDFFLTFFFCLCLFFSLFITIDAFSNLDEFLKHGVTLNTLLTYYLYSLPGIFVQIIPIAMLVSVLYVIGNMNRHYEIIALRASGLSSFQMLLPYLFIAGVISASVFLLNEMVVPKAAVNSAAIRDGLIKNGKKNFENRSISNVTFYGRGGTMIYAREFELSSQTLYDLVVIEDSARKTTQTNTTAKRADYENGRWLFRDAMTQVLNRRGDLVQEPEFYEVLEKDIPAVPNDFIHEASQISFMTTKELYSYIQNLGTQSRKLSKKLWVDLHYRVAFPFLSFVVVLIAAPLAMQSRNRGGSVTGIGVSLGVVLAYYWVASISLALGKGGFLPPFFAAWFSNFLFAGMGIYWIKNS
jgi:lipopolysaccharide export system permease protein